jgi:hypothetical protein
MPEQPPRKDLDPMEIPECPKCHACNRPGVINVEVIHLEFYCRVCGHSWKVEFW